LDDIIVYEWHNFIP